jgi:hypothetical protein
VLALHLELAAGNDIFHVGFLVQRRKMGGAPAKRAAPYATAYRGGKGDFWRKRLLEGRGDILVALRRVSASRKRWEPLAWLRATRMSPLR